MSNQSVFTIFYKHTRFSTYSVSKSKQVLSHNKRDKMIYIYIQNIFVHHQTKHLQQEQQFQ